MVKYINSFYAFLEVLIMFRNIGVTIKILAKVILCAGYAISALAWACYLFLSVDRSNEGLLLYGFLVLFAGLAASTVTCILVYGFGTLVENSEKITQKVCEDEDWSTYN